MTGNGWRRVLITTTAAGLLVLVLASAVAAVVHGAAAAASAASGGGLVILLSFLSLALIDWAERHRPRLAIPLFMVGFGLKVVTLALVLPFVRPGDWLHPGWALGSGIAVLVVWQVAEVWTFSTMRITVEPAS